MTSQHFFTSVSETFNTSCMQCAQISFCNCELVKYPLSIGRRTMRPLISGMSFESTPIIVAFVPCGRHAQFGTKAVGERWPANPILIVSPPLSRTMMFLWMIGGILLVLLEGFPPPPFPFPPPVKDDVFFEAVLLLDMSLSASTFKLSLCGVWSSFIKVGNF